MKTTYHSNGLPDFRHTQLPDRHGVITTHCTVTAGDGDTQTAVTFRTWLGGCDVLAVTRPFPKSGNSSFDSSHSLSWGLR